MVSRYTPRSTCFSDAVGAGAEFADATAGEAAGGIWPGSLTTAGFGVMTGFAADAVVVAAMSVFFFRMSRGDFAAPSVAD